MAVCLNHPKQKAVGHCKSCHRPICKLCRLETDSGVFCGQKCADKSSRFLASHSLKKKTQPGILYNLVVVILVLCQGRILG